MDSHLISRTLLKRFTSGGVLSVFNKEYKKFSKKSPAGVAYIQLPRYIFGESEKEWDSLENKAPEIFKSIENNTVFNNSEMVELVKRFIALHFVRSRALVILFNKTEKSYFKEVIKGTKESRPDKIDEIDLKTPESYQLWRKNILRELPTILKNSRDKITNYMNPFSLEIGVAAEGSSFILSDIPVFNMSRDGRVGLLSGVAMDQSDTVVMPFGPKHMVALVNKNKSKHYINLTTQQVDTANLKFIKNSIKEFYCLPDVTEKTH